MKQADENTSKVCFNTGRHYGPEGQRIVAMQCPSGEVVFVDRDRGITGVLTEASNIGIDSTGGGKVFPPLTAKQVQAEVTRRYVNDYAYQGSSLPYHLKAQLLPD